MSAPAWLVETIKPLLLEACPNCDGRKCMDCIFRYMHDACDESCPDCCSDEPGFHKKRVEWLAPEVADSVWSALRNRLELEIKESMDLSLSATKDHLLRAVTSYRFVERKAK